MATKKKTAGEATKKKSKRAPKDEPCIRLQVSGGQIVRPPEIVDLSQILTGALESTVHHPKSPEEGKDLTYAQKIDSGYYFGVRPSDWVAPEGEEHMPSWRKHCEDRLEEFWRDVFSLHGLTNHPEKDSIRIMCQRACPGPKYVDRFLLLLKAVLEATPDWLAEVAKSKKQQAEQPKGKDDMVMYNNPDPPEADRQEQESFEAKLQDGYYNRTKTKWPDLGRPSPELKMRIRAEQQELDKEFKRDVLRYHGLDKHPHADSIYTFARDRGANKQEVSDLLEDISDWF